VIGEAAEGVASLAAILNQQLAAYPANVSVVNTATAQHFALIAHELATNAVKYGAL
jgi:two-component sensor histidine kinase